MSRASDEDLLARQSALQDEAQQVLADLDLAGVVGDIGPLRLMRLAKGLARRAVGDTGRMVDDTARDRAIYHALKAADEVAAALQAHLIEEHRADPDRTAAQNPSTNSLKLLRQARERLGQGLRAIEAEIIAESDRISLRNPWPQHSASRSAARPDAGPAPAWDARARHSTHRDWPVPTVTGEAAGADHPGPTL
jgi:hypothetical protein